MKRLIIFAILMMLIYMPKLTHASANYHAYESLTLHEGKLLEDFEPDDYKSYYKHVDKRKFMGWRTYTAHKNISVSYISETYFSYYNTGTTPIDYKYKLDRKVSDKLHLSASGSIGIKNQKMEKTFKNNLDAQLKLSADYQRQTEERETIEVSLKVDPNTQVDLYIYGEGKITNGVAARYLFWIRADRGGYEVFLITTQYQRLEKRKI